MADTCITNFVGSFIANRLPNPIYFKSGQLPFESIFVPKVPILFIPDSNQGYPGLVKLEISSLPCKDETLQQALYDSTLIVSINT